jgi:hypothetical protein
MAPVLSSQINRPMARRWIPVHHREGGQDASLPGALKEQSQTQELSIDDPRDAASELVSHALLTAIPQFLHPAKVAIIEAIVWIEEPLSASQLKAVLEHRDWDLSLIAYHVKQLWEKGVLECVLCQQVRGAVQHFYDIRRTS